MKKSPIILVLGSFFFAGAAQAKCETLLKGLEDITGDGLVARYKQVVACDITVANQVFPQFMRGATDADTLVALSLAAIDADVWNPVWNMIGKISSYEARDEVATRVGLSCTLNPKVVGFLQGAYYGLRDIEFSQWDDAISSCEAPDFQTWLVQRVEDPPAKLYDEKWSALTDALVNIMHAESIPHLAVAAKKAATNGGPFKAILAKMSVSVMPEMGDQMAPEDKVTLEGALVALAREIPADQARAVADQLSNAGSDAKAAELLPTVYPNYKQDGYYLYGAASVESGTCEGNKQAYIHYAVAKDPGTHWIIMPLIQTQLQAFKTRLGCDAETPWPTLVSPEPFNSTSGVSTWLAEITREWEGKGYVVKTKEEKGIVIR